MNDEFLYQARPELRSEFADELYARISKDRNVGLRFWRSAGLKQMSALRLGIAIVVGLVIFVACVQQLLEPRNVQVGTMWVQEGGDTVLVPKGWGGSIVQGEPVLSSPPEQISIDEAIKMVPYIMKVPEWSPEGFSLLQDTVRPPIYPLWVITLTWSNSQNDQIMLFAFYGQGGEISIQVPRGMWKEVSVNGLPAVLVRGDFPYSQLPPPDSPEWETGFERTWDKNAGLRLDWNQGGARFSLRTFGNYLDEGDLIRMAESMRTW